MTEQKKPFVASLRKTGAPEEFIAKELVDAKDWEHAESLALDWAPTAISEGGISEPTELHLKHGAEGKFIRKWQHV